MSEVHPTNKACMEAIDRIARTPDGAAFYVYLQRKLMSVSGAPSKGALRREQGERIFAAELITAMAKGIFESGGRAGIHGSNHGPDGSEQPVVVPVSSAVRVSPRLTARERIAAGATVAGYDLPKTE